MLTWTRENVYRVRVSLSSFCLLRFVFEFLLVGTRLNTQPSRRVLKNVSFQVIFCSYAQHKHINNVWDGTKYRKMIFLCWILNRCLMSMILYSFFFSLEIYLAEVNFANVVSTVWWISTFNRLQSWLEVSQFLLYLRKNRKSWSNLEPIKVNGCIFCECIRCCFLERIKVSTKFIAQFLTLRILKISHVLHLTRLRHSLILFMQPH